MYAAGSQKKNASQCYPDRWPAVYVAAGITQACI